MNAQWDLTDRVAVVTGCASGIGRAIALAFAQAGADVIGLDIAHEGGARTAMEVEERGRQGVFIPCDVTDHAAVEAAFAAADRHAERIDILVNDAFKGSHAHPETLPHDEWRAVLDVNVTGYFFCAQAAGRRMIDRGAGGAIVNVSSIAGSTALGRGNIAYSVSKGAINQLTRELAIEWARYGIRVNAIQPCQVRTPALQALIDDERFASDEIVATFLRGIPLGRLAEPRDIADAAVFLVSDAAAMITGVMLPVDGGNLALNAGGTIAW